MAHDRARPHVGDVVALTLGPEGEAEPFLRAEYRIDSAPNRSPTADPREATRIYRTRLLTERWRSPALAVEHAPPPASAAVPGSCDGLAIDRPGWQFIRDNRALLGPGLSASVLAAGTSAREYASGREGTSATWVLRVEDAHHRAEDYIRIRFRLQATYYAMPQRPGIARGHYLSRIGFDVRECVAAWPSWIEAAAQLQTPTDRGTGTNRIPEVTVYAKFSWGWIGSAHRHACAFRVNGLTGFASVGARLQESPLPAH
jgi:hypothetical protein